MIPWTVATRFLRQWNSSGKNTGVDCLSLLQGIFSTQGLNLGLLYCRQILYHLSHQGIPEQGVLCKSMCIEDERDWSSALCRKSGWPLRSSWLAVGGLVTVRGHACNILFLDSGASYMCQVCENVLSYTLIFYAFFCVSVQFSRSVVSNSLRPHESHTWVKKTHVPNAVLFSTRALQSGRCGWGVLS